MAGSRLNTVFADPRLRVSIRIALVFLGLSYIYLYSSDRLVEALMPVEWQFAVNVSKGFIYVTIVALGLVYFIHRALSETQTAEMQFKLLFENSPDGILLATPGGVIEAANPAAAKMVGWDRSDLTGKSYNVVFDEIAPDLIRTIQQRKHDFTLRQRFVIRRKTGETVPVLVSLSQFEMSNGEMRICAILHDMSEAEKHESRYREGERLRLVGLLSGGVAHDFNNLLTVISGNTEILLELSEPETPQKRAASIIWMASQQAAQLIRHLLAFARRQSLDPAIFSVRARLTELMPLLAKAVGSPVQVDLKCDEDVWFTYADVAQFENAVLNLVLNAKDALTDDPTVLIEAVNVVIGPFSAFEEVLVPGDYVALSVTDRGTGMDAEVATRAVEPFFTTKEAGHGIGLGLSTVFGFVKQSGGHLDIRSEPGKGTVVTIFLPRPVDIRHAEVEPQEQLEIIGGNEKILVVEDDPLVRVFLDNALSQLGYSVVSVTDGYEALSLLGNHSTIDLLIADVVLPRGMSGRDLAARLRKSHPEMGILFISGFPDEPTADAERSPALKKPFQVQDLAKRIRQTLDTRSEDGATG